MASGAATRVLEGKVALITGTGGGQGRAAALLFASEGALVAGGDLKELVETAGGTMISHQPLDVADGDAVRAWVDAAAAEFGGIDILYNNAGATRFKSISEMSVEEWRFTLRNELDIVFEVTRAAWPHLVARGGGAIVNTASIQGINALRGAAGGFAHGATKHGVIGMTRELANEGGPLGIRVNSISPGLIDSPATVPIIEEPELLQQFLDHQIIKRAGTPDDIAQAALFLASERASFITGENLVVDGGFTVV
jgi:meso-butanediol dehydrogenase / (S,S)-butanediol dehydrogenase / diacetyl reductase